MALKKLVAKKKRDDLAKTLEETRSKEAGFLLRETELDERELRAVEALNELTHESSAEEREAVEREADEIEAAREALAAERAELEAEVADLERQIEELDAELVDDEPPETEPETEPAERTEKIIKERNSMGKYETRAQMLERLDREEVREFYTEIVDAAQNKRALTGGSYTIPDAVVDVIMTKMGDYAKVMPLVDTIRLKGTARVLIDGAIPEGIWVEACDALQELSATITKMDLDCYKVGGYIAVCNSLIKDSFINLANYVETKLAQAIAKAVDKGILNGTGSTGKMPEGIIPALNADADQQYTAADLKGIMAAIATVDTGEEDIGALTAVMRRKTYYTYIQPEMLLATSAGTLAMQAASDAVLPDGTRVVFSQYVPPGKIVIGDFKAGYKLLEREDVELSVSTEAQFIADNTVFKGLARYDGKPVSTDYFVLVTMSPRKDSATGLTLTAAAGTTAGTTKITASPTKGASNSHFAKRNVNAPAVGEIVAAGTDGWFAYTAGNELAAIAGEKITLVEAVTATGAVVKAGSIVLKASEIKSST